MLAELTPASRARDVIETAIAHVNQWPLAIPQTMARFALAGVFFRSGMSKLANWDLTVQLFTDEYHLPLLPPDLAALMGTTLELSMPAFLVLGLFTRLAVLPLLGMTVVIEIFVYPQNWPEHLTWATMLLLLFMRGAGPLSADHVIARLLHGER
jgi:putative oxidoreductase